MTPSELRVRRVSHRGHVMEWTLNPLWVQLEQTGDPEFGIERLYLVSRGRHVPVGYFLGPEEKASFSKALTGCAADGQARHHLQSHKLMACLKSGGLDLG